MGGRGTASGLASTPNLTQQAAAPTPAPAQAPAPDVTQPAPQSQPAQGRQITRADVPRLQRAMGQTGDEAGKANVPTPQKLYVNTSKSFNINAYLRSGMRSVHDASGNSQWEHLGYTTADAALAVAKIDAGMKALPENIALTRFVGGGALGSMLGNPRITSANVDRIIQDIKTPQGAAKFAASLARAQYTEEGYASTTYLKSHPAFDTRQIRLNIVAKKGTKAIVTNNHAESEVLLGRHVPYKFTGGFRVVRTSKGVDQLEIDVEI